MKAWSLDSGQGLPSVCKCQCSYSPFLGSGLSKGELFHTGWNKSCRTKSGIHGNGGNAKRRWQEENFTKLMEQFDSHSVSSGITNVVNAEKMPTNLPQVLWSARTPDAHSKRETSTGMVMHTCLRFLIRKCDACTSPLKCGEAASQPRLGHPLLLTHWG